MSIDERSTCHKLLTKMTYAITDSQAPQVIDYSDKAIAVIGVPKEYRRKFQEEWNATFNFRLKCGPGWIISKRYKDDVIRFIDYLNE